MHVLALDTTTRAGSVALLDDERVVDERSGDGTRTHAARLPAEITAMIAANGRTLSEIDLYAVASGPGSFTGLRIGIATIQGLALVDGRRIAGISALDALGHLGSVGAAPGSVIAAWMDAHRHQVFAALYRVTGEPPWNRERLVEIEGPTVGDPGATLARWAAQFHRLPDVFAGDGAVLYANEIGRGAPAALVASPRLLAGAIGRLAIGRQSDAVEPGAIRALYVRRPDAEIARDEQLRLPQIDTKAR